jgi:hypothetical protein
MAGAVVLFGSALAGCVDSGAYYGGGYYYEGYDPGYYEYDRVYYRDGHRHHYDRDGRRHHRDHDRDGSSYHRGDGRHDDRDGGRPHRPGNSAGGGRPSGGQQSGSMPEPGSKAMSQWLLEQSKKQ